MLLPGTLCDASLWKHQLAHLADIAHVCVGDLTRSSSVSSAADEVLTSAPARFALAGFSMGAIVALEIMRRAPERVERLALVSANARGSTPENLSAWQSWESSTLTGKFDDVLSAVGGWLYPDYRSELEPTVKTMGKRVGKEAFLRQLEILRSRDDSRQDLAVMACSTLLVAGRQDPATPVALHEEMAQMLPSAELVIIEKCGHYSPLERPEVVTEALRKWLGG